MSTIVNEAGIALMAILLVATLPIVTLASLVRLLHSILSNPGDWGGAIAQEVKILVRRTFTAVAVVVALGCVWGYWKDAQRRADCEPDARDSEHSPDGSYLARYCYFRNTIVLRLYDKEGKRLLAERTYRDTSGLPVSLYWKEHALMYAEEQELGGISLPPTFLDRAMAQLP
ncbi:hypothetical protein [Burkholderia anthina]|uniref:hypothetical protein n=1 Tax=Burkholderia anthina TaxID=179879 RepID=UPI000F5B140A|nr:hypothetical protein [Burkholderia anthina]RQV78274.1 hypothetical protein DF160_22815 [Burkholderia anthina]